MRYKWQGHTYAPSAIYELDADIRKNPHIPFWGNYPCPGPKPPKVAFLIIAHKLRQGVKKMEEFRVGDDCRVQIVPVTKNWEIVDTYVNIDVWAWSFF